MAADIRSEAVLQRTYNPESLEIEEVRKEAEQAAATAVRFLLSLDQYEFETPVIASTITELPIACQHESSGSTGAE